MRPLPRALPAQAESVMQIQSLIPSHTALSLACIINYCSCMCELYRSAVVAGAHPRPLPRWQMQMQPLIRSHASLSLLQVMRKQCSISSHKALVTRLLFILTRCSRLVLTGEDQLNLIQSSADTAFPDSCTHIYSQAMCLATIPERQSRARCHAKRTPCLLKETCSSLFAWHSERSSTDHIAQAGGGVKDSRSYNAMMVQRRVLTAVGSQPTCTGLCPGVR